MSVYCYIILETQKGQIVWDLMLHLFQPNTKMTQGILKNTRYSGGYYVCIKYFSPRENCLSTRSAVKRPTDWANAASVNTCKSTWGLRLRLLSLLTSLGRKAFKRVSPRIQSSKISYAITCSHIEGWALKITGVTCTYFLICILFTYRKQQLQSSVHRIRNSWDLSFPPEGTNANETDGDKLDEAK